MQDILIDKPYKFIGPSKRGFWIDLMGRYLPFHLKREYGVVSYEIKGIERLRESIAAGESIMLAPNHCRPCDPMLIGLLGREVKRHSYIMASWHLFMESRIMRALLPRLGVFSVHREGLDRESVKFAVDVLDAGERMLVLFPEGVVTRTNFRLNPLMDGTAFIANMGAKKRIAAGRGDVHIHPVAIRYLFEGDIEKTVIPVIEKIEKRLSWNIRSEENLIERIRNIGDALLTLKELEYFGESQQGALNERISKLIEQILRPIEIEWLGDYSESDDIVMRVKRIRMAVMPEMSTDTISESERARRWKYLADTYLAQQLYLYPPDYLGEDPSPERILETVERLEEDLTDRVTFSPRLRAVMEIGDAIRVDEEYSSSSGRRILLEKIRRQIERMLRI